MKLPWLPVEPVRAREFAEIRHAAIFECCKWDPQVEDVSTLSPLPIILTSEAWSELVALSEALARETFAAEKAILERPHLLKKLGLPWSLRWRLAALGNGIQTSHPRLIRFDFHFTADGWRISEANSDVPGGFNEASGFTRLMAQHFTQSVPAGDPTGSIAAAIAGISSPGAVVALLHATAFSDDRQVMTYLARRLLEAGCCPLLAAPDHLRWNAGKAFSVAAPAAGPVDFVFRFFPADWLPALPRKCGWWNLLGNSHTPLCNPGLAVISQSKRFPLVWDQLPFRLPTWEAALPATHAAADFLDSARGTEAMVFKPSLGRVGDMIAMHGVTKPDDARKIARAIRRHPDLWIAQERFEAVPMATESGDLFPCIGVYTLDEKVIGAYGRTARQPLINHLAQDAAILIASETPPSNDPTRHDTCGAFQTLGA